MKPGENNLNYPMPIAMKAVEGGYSPHYGTDVEEVDAIGSAMVLIRRPVLEAFQKNSIIPFKFLCDEKGITDLSEDFYFCREAKKLGFPIHMDYRILCKHLRGGIDVKQINDILVEVSEKSAQKGIA